jgi:hypothetical protein
MINGLLRKDIQALQIIAHLTNIRVQVALQRCEKRHVQLLTDTLARVQTSQAIRHTCAHWNIAWSS